MATTTKQEPILLNADIGCSRYKVVLGANNHPQPDSVLTGKSLVDTIIQIHDVSKMDKVGETRIKFGGFEHFVGEKAERRGAKHPKISSNGAFYQSNEIKAILFYVLSGTFPQGGALEVNLKLTVSHEVYLNEHLCTQIKGCLKGLHTFQAIKFIDDEDVLTEFNVYFKSVKLVSQAEASLAYGLYSIWKAPEDNLILNDLEFDLLASHKTKYPEGANHLIYDLHLGSNNTQTSRAKLIQGQPTISVVDTIFAVNMVRAKSFEILENLLGASPEMEQVETFIDDATHFAQVESIKEKYGETAIAKYETFVTDVFTRNYEKVKETFGQPPVFSFAYASGGGVDIFKQAILSRKDTYERNASARHVFTGQPGLVWLRYPRYSVVFGMGLVD